eukprot:7582749-Pyramimonas_sp.AAC.1
MGGPNMGPFAARIVGKLERLDPMLLGEHLLDSTGPGKTMGSFGPVERLSDPGLPGFPFASQKHGLLFLGQGQNSPHQTGRRRITDHI